VPVHARKRRSASVIAPNAPPAHRLPQDRGSQIKQATEQPKTGSRSSVGVGIQGVLGSRDGVRPAMREGIRSGATWRANEPFQKKKFFLLATHSIVVTLSLYILLTKIVKHATMNYITKNAIHRFVVPSCQNCCFSPKATTLRKRLFLVLSH